MSRVVKAKLVKAEDELYWGIMGREKGKGKFKPFDYKSGRFVGNVIYQTMWPKKEKAHVQKLIDHMNEKNPGYEFKIVKRG
jgi:hypothetical protein